MTNIDYAILLAMFVVLGFGLHWVFQYYRKSQLLDSTLAGLTEYNSDMKKTLLAGLIARFATDNAQDEVPLDFERFVAKIFKTVHGGSTLVTASNSDFGVDIMHKYDDQLHLGHVVCHQQGHNVDFEPIAIIHSQMVKQGAQSGFVVTTTDFTSGAKAYAKKVGVELVNGKKLVELWIQSLDEQRQVSAELAVQKEA